MKKDYDAVIWKSSINILMMLADSILRCHEAGLSYDSYKSMYEKNRFQMIEIFGKSAMKGL